MPFYRILLLIVIFSFSAIAKKKDIAKSTTKVSSLGKYEGYSTADYNGYDYNSYYLPMRDSILIAVDVFLPKKLEKDKKIPSILYLNRYVRSLKAKFPFNLLKHPILTVVSEEEIKYFTSHGYACIIVDTRGSGASQGIRAMEFSPEEVKDGAEVADWIVKQAWCNGNIGTTGISYLGTTAEMMLINHHPNIKACVPRSNIFDLYNHVMFPGGVSQGCFVDVWGYTTRSLDANDFEPFGKQAKRLVAGINPVDGDKKNVLLNQAIVCHKQNFNPYKGIKEVTFRDEVHPDMKASADDFSIHNYRDKIESSGVPIFRIGGWYDGVLQKSCIEGYMNTSNTKRVMIGPWDHGPHYNVSPYAISKEIDFNVRAEILRFFDFYLKGIENGINKEPLFNYFSIAEEQWKSATTWPLPNTEKVKFYLSGNKTLVNKQSEIVDSNMNYNIDYYATSGNTSRYNSVTTIYMNGPTDYVDRKQVSERLLHFTSDPLNASANLAGHPIIDLQFSCNANDASVFVYLEDVAPDGSVTYVTEGSFRPMHRKISKTDYQYPGPYHSFKKADALPYIANETVQLSFDLAPIAYQFKQGHAIRIAIAGADIEHFDFPDDIPTQFNIPIHHVDASFIELPIVK